MNPYFAWRLLAAGYQVLTVNLLARDLLDRLRAGDLDSFDATMQWLENDLSLLERLKSHRKLANNKMFNK